MNELEQLYAEIKSCTKCELRQTATAPVCGIGDIGSKYMLIGEAPGRDEDKCGVPFVGMAGKKLDKLVSLAGIDLNACYLTNVCRCRPPDNRTPRKKEIEACKHFLLREIKLVQPKIIITLGATPLSLFSDHGVTQTHGTMFKHNGLTIISQYHPAASLHSPRLWATLLDDWQNLPEQVPHDYIVHQAKDINLTGMPIVSLDTETDNHGGIGQWSMAYRDGEGGLTVAPFYGARPDIKFNCPVVFHNAKYDIRELKANKMHTPEQFHDTMIAAYCMGLGKQAPKDDSKKRPGSDMVGGLGLKYLARRHLGMNMTTWAEVKDHPELVPEYNAADSVATYLLFEKWKPILPKHYFEIDMPLLPVLMAMEDRGIRIDPSYLGQYAAELDNKLAIADAGVQHLAFHTTDMQSYIYGTLEIEPWKFTDTGAPSVDSDVLEAIPDDLIKQVIAYKEIYKDKGTYVDSYVKGRDDQDRIHPEFKQTSTSTGRPSCARPNLQNVDKEGNMRKLFVAKEGHKLVRIDYNQLEWRILGAVTLDPSIIAALNSGKKIHQVTADKLNCKYDIAKKGNFAMIYGANAWKLAQTLGITIDEAKKFIAEYFKAFPGVKVYQDKMREIATSEKKVANFFGRTRRIDAMYSEQWKIREEGIKEAINMPIQGAGGEVVKLAMIDLHQKHHAPMINWVYDELLFEVPEKEAVDYAKWLLSYIPKIVKINDMEFTVEAGVGRSWYDSMQKENSIG